MKHNETIVFLFFPVLSANMFVHICFHVFPIFTVYIFVHICFQFVHRVMISEANFCSLGECLSWRSWVNVRRTRLSNSLQGVRIVLPNLRPTCTNRRGQKGTYQNALKAADTYHHPILTGGV